MNEKIFLWDETVPGGLEIEEQRPHMFLFPVKNKPARPVPAVVVFPGGAYKRQAPHEGAPVAEWLNSLGIAAFVLHYRTAPHRHPAPLLDAKRAVRLVRHNASRWGIDPQAVGILGFSAGGHLAATLGTRFDEGDPQSPDPVERVGCRPDLMILCYPVITMLEHTHQGSLHNLLGEEPDPALRLEMSNERRVRPDTPPTFLWHTADDGGVPVQNSLLFADALADNRVPFALHVYPSGRHGLGLAHDHPEVRAWTESCGQWLAARGFASREA